MRIFKTSFFCIALFLFNTSSHAANHDSGVYKNVVVSNMYFGNYNKSAPMVCISFNDERGTSTVSTCMLRGYGSTPTVEFFQYWVSIFRQHYLAQEKLWIRTKVGWNDPDVTRISNLEITEFGTSNGWDFGLDDK